MVKRVVFNGANDCSVVTEGDVRLEPGMARVETHVSLISTGTETIVLGRKFAPGTHWDKWVKYPFYPGYSAVGRVVEVSEGADPALVGRMVAARKGHGAAHDVKATECHVVPEGLAASDAVWFALAKIAFMGVKAGEVRLGSRVLVIGGGPIGQMAVRWCAAAGAERVVMVDMMAERLKYAVDGGASEVFGKGIDSDMEGILTACGGKPQIVIDSTGNERVFHSALGAVADRGTLVVLGDTGTPGGQSLTGDVITRGLKIVGAHDCHCDTEWSEGRIVQLFFTLLSRGRIKMEGMNTHSFTPEQAREAYDTAETRRSETMGIIFDWRRR